MTSTISETRMSNIRLLSGTRKGEWIINRDFTKIHGRIRRSASVIIQFRNMRSAKMEMKILIEYCSI